MRKKTSPEMTVLFYELTTNLKNMLNDVDNIPVELLKAAVESNLHPAGAQCWEYTWESQNPEADFKLKIMVPVATNGNDYHGKFKLEKVKGIKHLSEFHYGAWSHLKDTYAKIMAHMADNKLKPGNICRENYILCDFENPENCITEIQFQVQ